jgi:hypothetical protein
MLPTLENPPSESGRGPPGGTGSHPEIASPIGDHRASAEARAIMGPPEADHVRIRCGSAESEKDRGRSISFCCSPCGLRRKHVLFLKKEDTHAAGAAVAGDGAAGAAVQDRLKGLIGENGLF